jgi:hypothetical protein
VVTSELDSSDGNARSILLFFQEKDRLRGLSNFSALRISAFRGKADAGPFKHPR